MIGNALNALIKVLQKKSHQSYLKAFEDPKGHQLKSLEKILARTKNTDVRKKLGLENVRSYSDFKQAFDHTVYEDYIPFIDYVSDVENKKGVFTNKEVECFGVTSGTTTRQKKIPFQSMYREEYMRTVIAWYGAIRTHRPKALEGKVCYNVNPNYLGDRTSTGLESIMMGGYNFRKVPGPMKKKIYVCQEDVYFSGIDNEKIQIILLARSISFGLSLLGQVLPELAYIFLNLLFKHADEILIYIKTGVPPFPFPEHIRKDLVMPPNVKAHDRVHEVVKKGKIENIKQLFPDIDTIICWKTSTAGYYLERFKTIVPDDVALWDGIYSATEGWLNLTLNPDTVGGPVAVKSHFLEFSEYGVEDAPIIPVWELEDKKQYEIYITNSAGMFRYRINDIVLVDGFYKNTPCIQFVDKAGDYISINWERVTAQQIHNIVMKMIESNNLDPLRIDYFCIAACKDAPKPYFSLLIETDYELSNFNEVNAETLMKEANFMYEKSSKEELIAPIKTVIIPRGTYKNEILVSNDELMTQTKFSRILKKDEVIKKYCY